MFPPSMDVCLSQNHVYENVRDIVPEVYRNVYQHEMTSRIHGLFTYFWSYGPLNIVNSDFGHKIVSPCNLKTICDDFEKLYRNVNHHEIIYRTQGP